MANFRGYPGMFIEFTQDYENVKAGTIVQVLHFGGAFKPFITFVGLDLVMPLKNSGQYIKPKPPAQNMISGCK